jgi:dihydroxyacetone kinase-like protein
MTDTPATAIITRDTLAAWLTRAAALFAEHKAWLTELDAAIGDADHGTNITRGFAAIVEKLPTVPADDVAGLIKSAGMTVMSTVGGASGLLYGNFFMRAATALAAAGNPAALTGPQLLRVLEAGRDGIVQRGRAEPGDKTMIDAWNPALAALSAALEAGAALPDALRACATAAGQGAQDTIPMQARKGRASYLGERSIGHQDPGATSTWLLLDALASASSSASAAPAALE